MIILNDIEMNELINTKRTQITVEVIGYDVFEFVNDGFYKGMYRVHGNSLYDVPELDDNDNIISITKAGSYERVCVLPKFIKNYCPFTKGQDIVNVNDTYGNPQFSVLSDVKVLYKNDKYYWVISLIMV